MKLKTNNKFSKWLFKLACKFGYSPLLPMPDTVYIIPKYLTLENFIRLSCVIKIPENEYRSEYAEKIRGYAYRQILHKFVEEKAFIQNVNITSWYDISDNTETIKAELYILNKKGLEDFYERYQS